MGSKLSGRCPSDSNPRIHETDSRGPETETESLETELRVHRIHDTLETGLQSVPRSWRLLARRTRRIFQTEDFRAKNVQQAHFYDLSILRQQLATKIAKVVCQEVMATHPSTISHNRVQRKLGKSMWKLAPAAYQ